MMPEASIGDIMTFPDKVSKQCRFRLVKDGKIVGEVTFDNALGEDGKRCLRKSSRHLVTLSMANHRRLNEAEIARLKSINS